jgi:Xaa-Pro aminopeptidase
VPADEQKALIERAHKNREETGSLLSGAKPRTSNQKRAALEIGQFLKQSERNALTFSLGSCRVANNEFEQRRQIVLSGLAERKLDGLLVSWGPNLRYLSGFTGSNALLLITAAKAVLFTDPRYTIQAGRESTCQTHISKASLTVDAIAAMTKLRVKRVGYEPAMMSCDAFEALEAKMPAKAALVPVRGWIEDLRTVKSAHEIARIRRSVATNSRAFDQGVARVKPGMKEQDLAAELEYRMRRLGAEKPAFETIVAAGERSALPHAQPTAARFEKGQLIVVDMGAVQEGYCSDMTRMLFLGAPDAKVKHTYKAVLEAQLAGIDAVRAGARTAAVDAAARKVLRGYGLDRAFTHSTGHGLGLEIHEPPRLGKRDKSRLKAGMAITIEPGVYIEGFGGIRIEDTVLVTETGCEVLTPTSKELQIV